MIRLSAHVVAGIISALTNGSCEQSSDVIWRQKSGSTSALIMDCYLTAANFYVNQYRLIIIVVFCYIEIHRRGISPERLTDSLLDMTYQITTSPLLKSNQIVLQCRKVVLEYNIYIYATLRVVVSGASFWTAENFVIFRLCALSVVV